MLVGGAFRIGSHFWCSCNPFVSPNSSSIPDGSSDSVRFAPYTGHYLALGAAQWRADTPIVRPRHTPVGVYTGRLHSNPVCSCLSGLAERSGRERPPKSSTLVAGDYLQAAELAAAWIEAEPTIALPRIYAGRAALAMAIPASADHLRRAVA